MRSIATAVLAILTASVNAPAQDCAGWSAIGDPTHRASPSMAFDSARGRVVMFGGNNGGFTMGAYTSETWEYDGQRWVFRTLDGPFRASGAKIAYDAARQRTVVTGGTLVTMLGGPTHLRETWEWDGETWSSRGLAPVHFHPTVHAMEYMPGVGVVAFVPSSTLNATQIYIWDGVNWSLSPQQLPYFTGVMSCAYDPTRSAMILQTSTGTFAWDGAALTQIVATLNPYPRSIRFFPARNKVIGFHYVSGGPHIVELNPPGWTQIASMAGNGPAEPVASAPTPDGSLFIAGASQTNPRVIGWRLSGTTLTPVERRGPIGVEGPAMAYDALRRVSVAFSGRYGVTSPVFDTSTWELRGETWKLRATSGPLGRFDGSMAYDPESNLCILRGGSSSANPATWAWNGASWSNLGGTGPMGDGTMTWDSGASHLVYHDNDGRPHTWNGSTWTAFSPYSNPIGLNGGYAYDAARAQFIGVALNNGGSYRWTGSAWSRFINSTQTSTYQPNIVYSQRLGGVLLFGGFSGLNSDGSYPNRTYFLGSTATAWADLNIRGPFGRKYSGFVDDPTAERIVMHAGLSYFIPGDTWKYASGPAAVAVEPQPTAAPQGASAELYIIAKGGGVISYQWRRNGQPLTDDARISGARTDTLVLSNLANTDAGGYDVIVTNPCGADTSAAVGLFVTCQNDFNGDGDVGTDQDIEAFFACLGGNCCPACGTADFNGDGDVGTDQDIESFFRVLGGGNC